MFQRITRCVPILVIAACAGRTSAPVNDASVSMVIPTLFITDRIFGAPITTNGDTAILLLDTGDRSRLFDAPIQRMHWQVDTVQTLRGPRRIVSLPAFQSGHAIPVPGPVPIFGQRVVVGPPTDLFDTLMSARTVGQLGIEWYADRIWTFDYPRRQLLLRSALPPRRSDELEIGFDYRTDTAGNVLGQTPRVAVEVAGDSLLLLFDTGATVWLTDSAMSVLRDGQPAERSWNLVRRGTFEKWRQRHPEWRVIERASRLNGSPIIEVPKIRIAGHDVGPVLFGTIPDPAPTAVISPRTWIDGTLGGSSLRFFSVTVDYRSRVARFRPTR
jgi:hypothetical protein